MAADVTSLVHHRFAKVVDFMLKEKNVTVGSGKRGFGSSALQVDGKIFAMISSKSEFVVKLPKQRVASLVATGKGRQFDPGHGRLMKEWLVVEQSSSRNWLALAKEALAFVSSKGQS